MFWITSFVPIDYNDFYMGWRRNQQNNGSNQR